MLKYFRKLWHQSRRVLSLLHCHCVCVYLWIVAPWGCFENGLWIVWNRYHSAFTAKWGWGRIWRRRNAPKANMDDGDVDDGQQYGKYNLLSITKKGFKFLTGSGLDQTQCAPPGQISFCCTVSGQGDHLCWTVGEAVASVNEIMTTISSSSIIFCSN